ncbi:MAG: hypothetical protein ACRCXC_05995 [Legionella sp.]
MGLLTTVKPPDLRVRSDLFDHFFITENDRVVAIWDIDLRGKVSSGLKAAADAQKWIKISVVWK